MKSIVTKVLVSAILFNSSIGIGIGIGNTSLSKYCHWYWQQLSRVLLASPRTVLCFIVYHDGAHTAQSYKHSCRQFLQAISMQGLLVKVSMHSSENLYSPSKHGRQQTISNTNEIKQL